MCITLTSGRVALGYISQYWDAQATRFDSFSVVGCQMDMTIYLFRLHNHDEAVHLYITNSVRTAQLHRPLYRPTNFRAAEAETLSVCS